MNQTFTDNVLSQRVLQKSQNESKAGGREIRQNFAEKIDGEGGEGMTFKIDWKNLPMTIPCSRHDVQQFFIFSEII
jgi:hypothetical protein